MLRVTTYRSTGCGPLPIAGGMTLSSAILRTRTVAHRCVEVTRKVKIDGVPPDPVKQPSPEVASGLCIYGH
ncbi:hypothetical protein J6590_029889 [Homalodisca vitripennis]|nr:hypothetical protein J6590_029889 [Homalodisca vitripennis]